MTLSDFEEAALERSVKLQERKTARAAWIKQLEEKKLVYERKLEEEKKIEEEKFLAAVARFKSAKKAPRPKRRVRSWKWQSPADARARVWNIPEEEDEQSVLTAFLRVCIAEADGELQDCVGVWQVVRNIRSQKCNRGWVRKITECDDKGETTLSAFRRAQKHVLGMIAPKNSRVRWISKIETDCEPPENWPHSEAAWDSRYTKRCQHIVELGRYLLKGKLPPPRPGSRLKWLPGRPIAWGGRCESGKASCDDRMACRRGLVRVPGVDYTTNAFWIRSHGDVIEPVCAALG